LLPSTDDNDNNFSKTLHWDSGQPEHILWLGLFNCAYLLSPAPKSYLFKPKAYTYTLKMAKDELSAYFASPWRVPGCVINILSLFFTMSLLYRGKWPDLARGIPRVWA
jgi:hypothetical protein